MEESESAMTARLSRHQVAPSDFDLVALAGRGAFGKVRLFFFLSLSDSRSIYFLFLVFTFLGLGSSKEK